MRLLLISNSTMAGEAYLDYPKENIKSFLGEHPIEALFIPYAGVTLSYDTYETKVNDRFKEIGHSVKSIHHFENPIEAVLKAEAIVIGGGNTFELAKQLQNNKLIEPIVSKVKSGTPYIGWSAGSNMACPTIRTTNDMPIVEPESFNVLNLVPFQINPHYLDAHPEGHGGETREDRINEFIELNQNIYVVGLREGCMLKFENENLKLIGERKCRIFKYNNSPKELSKNDDFNFLLK
ncbi:MAG: dipeptidase PepE [Bacteroidales bacterium]|nr:dipeptidase PepE [Bacteroidales bacterium]